MGKRAMNREAEVEQNLAAPKEGKPRRKRAAALHSEPRVIPAKRPRGRPRKINADKEKSAAVPASIDQVCQKSSYTKSVFKLIVTIIYERSNVNLEHSIRKPPRMTPITTKKIFTKKNRQTLI